jgi:glycosyltransferase involved in cell wall biosynthesis
VQCTEQRKKAERAEMRVAIFTETFLPKRDGVVTILCQMLDALEDAGIEVCVYAPPSAPHAYRQMRVYPSWGPRFPLYQELYCSMPTIAGVRGIVSFKPDVIHVMNPTFIGTVGVIMAIIGRVPLIASVHMDIDYYVRQYAGSWGLPIAWTFFKVWHNRARINLAPSTAMVNQLTENGIERVRHWSRGIDTSRFCRTPMNAQIRTSFLGDKPNALVILYVGRLTAEKGIDSLLPFCNDPRYRVVLVGGGHHEAQTRARFAHTDALFTGVLIGSAVVEAYAAADIFIFPSVSESFGLAPLEAMACGLAVVAPYVGGLRDTLIPDENCKTYDHTDPSALSHVVDALAEDADERRRIATNGAHYAAQRRQEQSMQELITLYRQLAHAQ